jgi:hypothetical protein
MKKKKKKETEKNKKKILTIKHKNTKHGKYTT